MRLLFVFLAVLMLFGCSTAEAPKQTFETVEDSEKNLMGFWQSHYDEGEKAFFTAKYDRAEKELKLALQNIKRAGVKDERLGKTYHRLGSTYLAIGNLEKSEPLLLDALEIKSDKLGKDSPELLITLNNLGKLYMAQGKWGNAQPMLEQALSIGKSHFGENDPELIVPLINLGILYYEQEKYKQAEDYWEQALAVAQMNNNAKQIVIMENLMEVYKKTDRDRDAEDMKQRVAALTKKD